MEGAELQMKNKPTTPSVRVSILDKGTSRGQQPMLSDDSLRDRVLSQKAQALGLVSRDWTHISLFKKAASNTANHQIREEAISYRHTLYTHPNKEYCGEKKDSTLSRQGGTTSMNGRLNKSRRSVYEPDCSKGGPSRHTRQKCEMRRPATQCQKDRGSRTKYPSRPSTKLGKKMRSVLQCEESQYWREVPNRDHPQLQIGTGMCLRVDSLTSSMHCKSPENSMDCRPPQNTKLYPQALKYPFLYKTPQASANYELNGNRYRHITLTHKLSSRKTGNKDSRCIKN